MTIVLIQINSQVFNWLKINWQQFRQLVFIYIFLHSLATHYLPNKTHKNCIATLSKQINVKWTVQTLKIVWSPLWLQRERSKSDKFAKSLESLSVSAEDYKFETGDYFNNQITFSNPKHPLHPTSQMWGFHGITGNGTGF